MRAGSLDRTSILTWEDYAGLNSTSHPGGGPLIKNTRGTELPRALFHYYYYYLLSAASSSRRIIAAASARVTGLSGRNVLSG
ncbi:MAG: hypothetical protein PWP58_1087 [Bacillota bacterium]|nr:hypothetical protein [Bacillota bacterium]